MQAYQKVSFVMAVFVALVIYFLSSLSLPGGSSGGVSYGSFAHHLGIFFFFGSFLFLAIYEKRFYLHYIFIVFLLSFLYAVLDELHQYFVPGRTADFFDFVMNFGGSIAGGMIVGWFRR